MSDEVAQLIQRAEVALAYRWEQPGPDYPKPVPTGVVHLGDWASEELPELVAALKAAQELPERVLEQMQGVVDQWEDAYQRQAEKLKAAQAEAQQWKALWRQNTETASAAIRERDAAQAENERLRAQVAAYQREHQDSHLGGLIANHDFLPVAGHPDDDECAHRADGTDRTYCGEPRRRHL